MTLIRSCFKFFNVLLTLSGSLLVSNSLLAAQLPNGVIGNTLCLNADPDAGLQLYSRIESIFGKGAVEAPSDTVYSPPQPHVIAEQGEDGPYFAVLAIEPTDVNLDRRSLAKGGDRSRTELKIAPGRGPQAQFQAREGDTFVYTWRFKISPQMRFSRGFTHLHQIMASGKETAGSPLITFTARADGRLHILHSDIGRKRPKKAVELGQMEFASLAGAWLDVREEVLYSEKNGHYKLLVRDSTGKELLSIDKLGLSMWRPGAESMRPKWGIYRKHDAKLNQHRTDYVYFANFGITRGSTPGSSCRSN